MGEPLYAYAKSLSRARNKRFDGMLSDTKTQIFNLSDYSLSDTETFVLGNGLEFCIPPQKINREELFAEFEILHTQLAKHEILINNKTITSHEKNLQYLAIEIYKTFNSLIPPFMDEIFSINQCPYYLRNSKFKTAEPHYKIYGFNTVSYRCSQIWNSVPNEIKYSPTLQIFKKKISEFSSFNCTCNLCKKHVSNIGYI